MNLLQEGLNVAGNLAWNQETQEWRNTIDNTTMSKSDWKKLFSGLGSFLNEGVDFANPSSSANKPKTSVVGSITATGTATLNLPTGDFVYLGVPGSSWTSYLDETELQTTNGKNPEYPFYNNPLGTFALLKTPTFKVKRDNYGFCTPCIMGNPQAGVTPNLGASTRTHISVVLNEPLQYYINPVLDVNYSNSEIFVSLVIVD